jgi:hypothetical protein
MSMIQLERGWARNRTRTSFLGISVAFLVGACSHGDLGSVSAESAPLTVAAPPAAGGRVRTFRARIAESDLVDLRRRLAATRWPEKETVDDLSQGPQLARLQDLVRY